MKKKKEIRKRVWVLLGDKWEILAVLDKETKDRFVSDHVKFATLKKLQEKLDADYRDFYYQLGKYENRKIGFNLYKRFAHARDLSIAKAVISRIQGGYNDWELVPNAPRKIMTGDKQFNEFLDSIISELERGKNNLPI